MANYTIKKGWHMSLPLWPRLWPFSKKSISGFVGFNEECFTAIEDIPGWNKLTGISSWRIHKDSARFVWRAKGNSIRIAGYVYSNGVRTEKEITSIYPGDHDFIISLEHNYGSWWFTVNGKKVWIPARKPRGQWFKCFFYFGGRSTAPHTIKIDIDLIKE